MFVMSLLAAIISTALATASPSALCAGCTLDAPQGGQAMPLLVVLGDDGRSWRAPARAAGFATLTLANWQRAEPAWIEEQIFAAARQRSIDLARVYLIGNGEGAGYVSRHVQALSETFAAVVVGKGSSAPPSAACPNERLPVYFSSDDSDALRGYFEKCRAPIMAGVKSVPAILDWLKRSVRVTTVS